MILNENILWEAGRLDIVYQQATGVFNALKSCL